jgi:hypothetical protein
VVVGARDVDDVDEGLAFDAIVELVAVFIGVGCVVEELPEFETGTVVFGATVVEVPFTSVVLVVGDVDDVDVVVGTTVVDVDVVLVVVEVVVDEEVVVVEIKDDAHPYSMVYTVEPTLIPCTPAVTESTSICVYGPFQVELPPVASNIAIVLPVKFPTAMRPLLRNAMSIG